ncbi:outer membrane beta-barrel protein [Flavobacterium sp.]|uniref:outer membrane beta-barrel protein n=1 Tax=Flavobacterium sp. TaxID=239 RepID=UPI004047FED7
MRLHLLLSFLFISLYSFSQTGTVSGVILDKEYNNEPLPFANVLIKGTTIGTSTDDLGKYSLSVKPGNYVLEIGYLGYETKEIPFTIKAGEKKVINHTLEASGVQLDDIVVTHTVTKESEAAVMQNIQKAVEIKQAIGAQEMSRKGISDVEEGLTKVTNISKVESRGLFVRGLEDRYNNLLINGLQAPSNSPFKKIIPLDLFPTDIVGVLNVYKTFNPNIPGDFAGAMIDIETSESTKSETKLSVGFGYTTMNNGEDFLISSDANSTQGFLGLIKNNRELPAVFGTVPNGYQMTSSEYKNTHEKNSWNVDQSSSPINSSIGFYHSDKFSFENGNKFTYLLSLNADNKYSIRKGVDRTFNQGQGNYDKNLYREDYKYNTSNSTLINLKYKADRGYISVNSFYLRSTESLIADGLGYLNSLENNPNFKIRLNQFEQSDYFNNQILLGYDLTKSGNHSIKAGGSFVKTNYAQPDRKTIVGTMVDDKNIDISYGGNNLNRQYLEIKGNYYMSGLLEYNWKFGEIKDDKQNKLVVGINSFRNNITSKYRFLAGRNLIPTQFTTELNTINDIISEDVSNGIVAFREESNADYKIKLDQFVNAGYFNLFWNFGEKIEFNAGLRAESTLREIKFRPISASIDDSYSKDKNDQVDLLPSANIKYTINDESNIRFALSKTIVRPVTMELLPIQFVNPDATVELGNPNLKNSESYNLDLKYEMFTDKNEMFAVGLFGKQINNPIERIFIPTASSGGQITTYSNSDQATLFGAELEFIMQLSRISKQLDNFSLGFNTSIMKTNVKVNKLVNPLENNTSRSLQGASEWLINADLKYEFELSKELKNAISLVYGVYGDRIYAVGTAGLDHIYEKPFNKLDFVWSSQISEKLSGKFSVDNVLNPYYRYELGDKSTVNIVEDSLIMREYKKGVGFSLGLTYTFK